MTLLSITSPTNVGGYNISCRGGSDGIISVSTSGAVPPYTYVWNHGPTINNLDGQRVGLYTVRVNDANGASITASIQLTEPVSIEIQLTPSIYNNDYNISCHNCANGFINSSVVGGISPYSYEWRYRENIFGTTSNITNLDAGVYHLILTDALGCSPQENSIELIAPQRDDWSMYGNSNTDPNSQYIGTSDAKDVILKTNGTERLRIFDNGDLKLPKFAGNGDQILRINNAGLVTPAPVPAAPAWETSGNTVTSTDYIGTINNEDFVIKTNAIERMRVENDGKMKLLHNHGNNAIEVLSNNGIPTRRGISIGDNAPGSSNNDGSFNFFIHDWQGNAAFNFKRIDDDGSNNISTKNLFIINKNGDIIVNDNMEKITFGNWFSGQNYLTKSYIGFNTIRDNGDWIFDGDGVSNGGALILSNVGGDIYFSNIVSSGGSAQTKTDSDITDNIKMIIKSNGSVGIGEKWDTMNPDYKLSVCGAIRATKIKVENSWCDYVFEENYPLMSIFEVEEFIKENKHLPGIPKGSIIENEGLDLGNMQARQMEKIEEIVLWLIELKKENEQLKKEVEKLKKSKN